MYHEHLSHRSQGSRGSHGPDGEGAIVPFIGNIDPSTWATEGDPSEEAEGKEDELLKLDQLMEDCMHALHVTSHVPCEMH